MRGTHINEVLRMVRRYLSGKTDVTSFCRDFPREVIRRYEKMEREDTADAGKILYYLVENGTDRFDKLSETDFRNLIKTQYDNFMMGIY